MPTLLLVKGFRFFFYSNENDEPAHVHVTKGNANGKIWLIPVMTIAYLHDFNTNEQHEILQLVTDNCEDFKSKWNEYFSK